MRLSACLVLCCALAAAAAQARTDEGCAPAVEDALRGLNPKADIAGEAVSAHCKPWPPSGGKVLAAVMAFERGSDENRRWTGVLALLDARTSRLLHSRRFEIEEDAVTRVGGDSLRLDTANYALAPGVRALGLRYSSAGPGASAANSRRSDELTLFVPDGRSLRPVLGLSMSLSEAVTSCLQSCPDGVWDDATRSIAVGAPGPQGWNDLRVTATVVRDSQVETAAIDRTPQRKPQVYRYNGRRYELLSSQFDWDDYCCTIAWPPR